MQRSQETVAPEEGSYVGLLMTCFHPQLRLPKGLCVPVMGLIKFLTFILLNPIWLYLLISGNHTTLE